MKVLKNGKSIEVWSKIVSCTGDGTYDEGCGAELEIALEDLASSTRISYRPSGWRDGEYQYKSCWAFTCLCCGIVTKTQGSEYKIIDQAKKQQSSQVKRSPEFILTADIAVTIGGTDLVLIRRAKPPYDNALVLPGGHVEKDETSAQAAVREIDEEIGLDVQLKDLTLLTFLDAAHRDPREGRRVSVVYHVDLPADFSPENLRAGSDAEAVRILPLSEIKPEMIGFDHYQAIAMLKN